MVGTFGGFAGPQRAAGLTRQRMEGFGLAGFLLGAVAGFLLRPSVPLLGVKLPLGVVLTRGANLHGMDEALKPIAENSFNEMLIGALAGAAIGALVAWAVTQRGQQDPAPVTAAREERECPHCAERILAKAQVCKHCGKDVVPAG